MLRKGFQILTQCEIAIRIGLKAILIKAFFRNRSCGGQVAWRGHRQASSTNHEQAPGVHGCE